MNKLLASLTTALMLMVTMPLSAEANSTDFCSTLGDNPQVGCYVEGGKDASIAALRTDCCSTFVDSRGDFVYWLTYEDADPNDGEAGTGIQGVDSILFEIGSPKITGVSVLGNECYDSPGPACGFAPDFDARWFKFSPSDENGPDRWEYLGNSGCATGGGEANCPRIPGATHLLVYLWLGAPGAEFSVRASTVVADPPLDLCELEGQVWNKLDITYEDPELGTVTQDHFQPKRFNETWADEGGNVVGRWETWTPEGQPYVKKFMTDYWEGFAPTCNAKLLNYKCWDLGWSGTDTAGTSPDGRSFTQGSRCGSHSCADIEDRNDESNAECFTRAAAEADPPEDPVDVVTGMANDGVNNTVEDVSAIAADPDGFAGGIANNAENTTRDEVDWALTRREAGFLREFTPLRCSETNQTLPEGCDNYGADE